MKGTRSALVVNNVRYLARQLVLALALLAAWALLGGNQLRAAYVGLGVTNCVDRAAWLPGVAGIPESWQDAGGFAGAAAAEDTPPTEGSHDKVCPTPRLPSWPLPLANSQTRAGSGASPSGTTFNGGSPGTALGLAERPGLRQEELVRWLECVASSRSVDPFTSRLFRPPRAT
jgi:hypothetical protein